MFKYRRVHPDAKPLLQATPGSAAYDLTAVAVRKYDEGVWEYDTGIAVEIPSNCVAIVAARSSIRSMSAIMSNGIGVIDSDYRGTIKATFYSPTPPYKVGDRVAQIMFIPLAIAPVREVDSLTETVRGTGGHGSTGV